MRVELKLKYKTGFEVLYGQNCNWYELWDFGKGVIKSFWLLVYYYWGVKGRGSTRGKTNSRAKENLYFVWKNVLLCDEFGCLGRPQKKGG